MVRSKTPDQLFDLFLYSSEIDGYVAARILREAPGSGDGDYYDHTGNGDEWLITVQPANSYAWEWKVSITYRAPYMKEAIREDKLCYSRDEAARIAMYYMANKLPCDWQLFTIFS
jgi:hypothetical protein